MHGENDSASRREALKRELQERQVELREASSRHETVAHEETQAAQNANRADDEYDDFRRQTSELQTKMGQEHSNINDPIFSTK